MFTPRLFIAATSLCAVTVAQPQQISARPNNARSLPHAAKRFGAVKIDGRLDDAAWLAATPLDDFIQQAPVEGHPPTRRTEVRFLFDDDALYVSARMFDSLDGKGLAAALTQRNELVSWYGVASDRIAVVFATADINSDYAWLELNPFGARNEMRYGDTSNNPHWEGASSIDSLGWTAEFRIPLSKLRLSAGDEDGCGIQIWRTINQRQESDMWAFWKPNAHTAKYSFGF